MVPGSAIGTVVSLEERFCACLLGGAIGDALGAPVEFLSLSDIHARFGSSGLGRDSPGAFAGAITDDTQMTLFTAEGLIRAHNRHLGGGGAEADILSLHRAYLRWDYTQREVWPGLAPARSDTSGWLLQQPLLHRVRAPGRTCLSALRSDRLGTVEQPLNASKGCGGIMRAAPGPPGHAPGPALSEVCRRDRPISHRQLARRASLQPGVRAPPVRRVTDVDPDGRRSTY